jgi:hypothetical protein
MNADDYNRQHLAMHNIRPEHITALTRAFQRSAGLEPDGKLGPVTRRALEAVPEVTDEATTAVRPVPLRGAAAAVAWAREARALWATATPAVRKAMCRTFFAESPEYENWCAAFVSSALEAGGIDVPRLGPTRRGARALTRWVAEQGSWVLSETYCQHLRERRNVAPVMAVELLPGDVLCWQRVRDSWECHVAVLLAVNADGSIEIAEGNATDPVTRKAGQLVVQTLKAIELPTRLQGLYGVARPNYGGGR